MLDISKVNIDIHCSYVMIEEKLIFLLKAHH